MFRRAFHSVARVTVRAGLLAASLEFNSILRPHDQPRAHAGGPDPNRILVFGCGVAEGRGVLSHDLALPGQLARRVAVDTLRGVDVDVIAHSELMLDNTIAALEPNHLDQYDAIVISVGLNDALALTPVREWRKRLIEITEFLARTITPSTHVFFVDTPELSVHPLSKTLAGRICGRHAALLSRETRAVLNGVSFASSLRLSLTPVADVDRPYRPETYAQWADEIAPEIVTWISEAQHAGISRPHPRETTEPERHAAVQRLHILDTDPEEGYDRVVRMARSLFGTSSASFSLVDGDRLWLKASTGVSATQFDRLGSLCAATIGEPHGVMVGDASRDERFANSPLVVGEPYVRFYAGVPINAPDGITIGSLCVFDPEPRAANPKDVILLKELALMVEKELWDRVFSSRP